MPRQAAERMVMMKQQYLEAGKIVNTHGIRGEVKIQSWGDSPEFLCTFSTLYLDGSPVRVLSARPHKGCVIAQLEGIHDVNEAMALKNKVVSIARADAKLPKGSFFLADIEGMTVLDAATGETLGTVTEILTPPAHNVYVVTGKGKRYLIPAVDAFVTETNVDEGYLKVNLIEGLEG